MSLKTFKPYTKSTRTTILVDRKNLWKGPPIKSLTQGKISSGGRNNLGRITSRSKGSGHKKRYRLIDFYRNKLDIKAKVERIEYDPNRTSYIALVKYDDGLRNYIICPNVKLEIIGIFRSFVRSLKISLISNDLLFSTISLSLQLVNEPKPKPDIFCKIPASLR